MLLATLLLAGQLVPLPPPAPAQAAPPDTVRTVPGLLNQPFAWGTLVLRDGRRLQGYLPVGAALLEGVVPYYALPPDAQPPSRPKLWPLLKVRAMRVKGQQYEVLTTSQRGQPLLATRRQAGAAELFVLEQRTMAPSFLGAAPVMGLPASSPSGTVQQQWYLRRSPEAAPLLLTPENFAAQLALLLADDPELAAQVTARAPGYQFADLEAIIVRYNQRAAARKL